MVTWNHPLIYIYLAYALFIINLDFKILFQMKYFAKAEKF